MKKIIEELFSEEYNNLKYYLLSRFSSLSIYDVEDIISHTVIKMLSKGNSLINISNVQSYLYSAVKNNALDHIKTNKKDVYNMEYNEIEQCSAENEAINNELKEILAKAINNLDKKSKYIFIETEIKGRSFKEISDETNIKIGTLLSQKSRATKKLQKYLSIYYKEDYHV